MIIKLTPRERQVAELLLLGLHTKEIASELDISVRVVKGHLTHMYLKAHIEDGIKVVKLVVLLYRQFRQEERERLEKFGDDPLTYRYWQQP